MGGCHPTEAQWELCVRGEPAGAVEALLPSVAAALSDISEGLSVRMRAQYFNILSDAHEAAGQPAAALAALRQGQRLHRAQAQLASRARYQAATLQTELLRLQHRLDENDAHRRATERARAELAAINAELTRQVEQVQSLQHALQQQATHDSLTGLFNRRHLNDALPTLFALAERESQTMALAIIDLDHFKRVNDEHGHAAGDRLLAAFGELLARHCRRSDVACRYGGEEFQDTWLRVVHARERWAPQGASFRTWLFTLAHHRAVDVLRRSGREVSIHRDDDDDASGGEPWQPDANSAAWQLWPAPDATAVDGSDKLFWRRAGERLLGCLEQLPLPQRSAFLLHHDDGLPLDEVASALKVGYETAKTRLRYAMSKLRTCMGAYLAPLEAP